MGFLCGSAILTLMLLLDVDSSGTYIDIGLVMAITAFLIIFTIVAIVMAAIALKKGLKNEGNGFAIATIVLVGIIAILEILGGTGQSVVYGLLCLATIGLEITYLCLKPDKVAPKNNQSLEAKISELKHMREIGVISEEQYKTALDRVLNESKE